MFASRLLGILEAVPEDVKFEMSNDDGTKQDMVMKENRNAALSDSESFGRETDPRAIESKEAHWFNGPEQDNHLIAFVVKDRDGCWNPKFVDDFSMDDESSSPDTLRKEDRNGLLHHLSSMDTSANRDSGPADIAASDLFDKESTSLCTDKDFDTPELMVCYKEVNHVIDFKSPELMICYKEVNHVVKDIGVDEGMPAQEENLFESIKEDASGHLFPEPLCGYSDCKSTESSGDLEDVLSCELVSQLLDNAKDVRATKCGQESRNSPLRSSSAKDVILKPCCPENSSQDVETSASEEDSHVDRWLPLQEYGTRSFLRSFLDSTDGECTKVKQLPHELGKAGPECTAASSAEPQSNKLRYDSKVESGSITFNFSINGGTENDRSKGSSEDNNVCHALLGEGKYEVGETSFSACHDLGPTPFSGSISLGSDGSGTSSRSFAFPILQPDWDCSPVRMARADRSFRKHKCWRSRLTCCKF